MAQIEDAQQAFAVGAAFIAFEHQQVVRTLDQVQPAEAQRRMGFAQGDEVFFIVLVC